MIDSSVYYMLLKGFTMNTTERGGSFRISKISANFNSGSMNKVHRPPDKCKNGGR